MLKLKNIKKVYNSNGVIIPAINDLSLEVLDGEFVAIMGRSGCGKTTLLNIIGTLEFDYEGEHYMDNDNVRKLSARDCSTLRRSKIAIIHQNYNIFPEMSLYNNIIIPSVLAKEKPSKQHAEELAELLDLKDRLDVPAGKLSGGEKQRTAIARALYQNAEYILADEPTGNLDYENGIKIMEIFKRINIDNNKTIIMVTHDEEMAGYASRVIRLIDGKEKTDEHFMS